LNGVLHILDVRGQSIHQLNRSKTTIARTHTVDLLVDHQLHVFYLVWAGLLSAPVLLPLCAWGVTKLSADKQRLIYKGLATAAASILVFDVFEISSTSDYANASAVLFVFWVLLLFLLSAYRLEFGLLRHSLGSVGVLLLLACTFFGSFGAFAIGFVVSETLPARVSANDDAGLTCYVTTHGNATTRTGGYTIIVAQHLSAVPFLEAVVIRKKYEQPKEEPKELCEANF
jgi:hypothetical protein